MKVQGSRVAIVFSLFLAGGPLFLFTGPVSGQTLLPPKELKEAAREILLREQESVVWVTAKVRLRNQSDGSAVPGEEATLEVLGTVVEESGLTVVSDAGFRPEKAFEGKPASGDVIAEFGFVEIVVNKEISVPATVIYRDADLDLAFLKPDEKIAKQRGAKFRPVDAASGHSLEVMDDVVHVGRLDASMDHAASVGIGNVASVVRGSRTFYQMTKEIVPGTPMYSADGSLLGIGVHRIVDGKPSALVALSSETVKVIAEIAEATGFLATKSKEMGTSLTEGLTLSLPEKKGAPAPEPKPAPLPATIDVSTPPKPAMATVTPIPEPAAPVSASGPTIRTVTQPAEKPRSSTVKVIGAKVMPPAQAQAEPGVPVPVKMEPPPVPEPAPAPAPVAMTAVPEEPDVPATKSAEALEAEAAAEAETTPKRKPFSKWKPISESKTKPKPKPEPVPLPDTMAAKLKPSAVADTVVKAKEAAGSSEPGKDRPVIPPPDPDSEKRGMKGFLGKIKFQSRRQADQDAKDSKKETAKPVVLEEAPEE